MRSKSKMRPRATKGRAAAYQRTAQEAGRIPSDMCMAKAGAGRSAIAAAAEEIGTLTGRELIIAGAVLFGYMLTSLYLTQTLAQAIADAHVNKWALMALINVFLLVCGFFIPPAAIILMTSPILYPIVRAAGFDPVWFGVILTINMEVGLIHPPVGLNIYIVNSIAPDVPVTKVMWGTIPYVLCMFLAIVILSVFPEIATWLPNQLMGAVR